MSARTMCVRCLNGDLYEFHMTSTDTAQELSVKLRTELYLPSEHEATLTLFHEEKPVPSSQRLESDGVYDLLVQPIPWRVIFPETVSFGRKTTTAFCYMDLTTGTVHPYCSTDHHSHELFDPVRMMEYARQLDYPVDTQDQAGFYIFVGNRLNRVALIPSVKDHPVEQKYMEQMDARITATERDHR